ncbi:hypothetical protein [Streptomyces sp. AD55]|uniref:hypothetical protein n=1 Tax=Streptomyces sp. AD55 TaxID=3242895 RepID=UPI003526F1A1
MVLENGVWVCRKCGGSFDAGAKGRKLVAAGIIARRTRGRSLHLAVTTAGVTGHLRRQPRTGPAGGCGR